MHQRRKEKERKETGSPLSPSHEKRLQPDPPVQFNSSPLTPGPSHAPSRAAPPSVVRERVRLSLLVKVEMLPVARSLISTTRERGKEGGEGHENPRR